MQLNLTKQISQHRNRLPTHIILHCLTDAVTKELLGIPHPDGITADVCFSINGHELDFEEFCRHWESQVDKLIQDEAVDLFQGKFNDVAELLNDLEERLKEEVKKRMDDSEKEEWEEEERSK